MAWPSPAALADTLDAARDPLTQLADAAWVSGPIGTFPTNVGRPGSARGRDSSPGPLHHRRRRAHLSLIRSGVAVGLLPQLALDAPFSRDAGLHDVRYPLADRGETVTRALRTATRSSAAGDAVVAVRTLVDAVRTTTRTGQYRARNTRWTDERGRTGLIADPRHREESTVPASDTPPDLVTQLRRWRHDLHRIPSGLRNTRTGDYLAEALAAMGCVTRGIGGTGLVATVHGNAAGGTGHRSPRRHGRTTLTERGDHPHGRGDGVSPPAGTTGTWRWSSGRARPGGRGRLHPAPSTWCSSPPRSTASAPER